MQLGSRRPALALERLQRLVIGAAARGGRRARRTVVVPTTGGGNIGDQALFEAFLRLVDGPVDVLVDSPDAFVLPAEHAGRVTRYLVPAFQHGSPLGHLRSLLTAGRVIGGADAVAVVGADILDGGYGTPLASVRWAVATAAAASGRPTLVSSMSWNGRPAPGVLEMARAAGAAGAVIGARDPASAERMAGQGVLGVELTADVVFTQDTPAEPDADVLAAFEAWRDPARPLVLLNVSGLIGRTAGLEGEYHRVVAALDEAGAQVLLVPHVDRPDNSDVAAADAALPAAEHPGLLRLDRLVAPAQIAWFTSRAAAVVTGRMHLSILALGQGTPAVVLSTQGKVTGLMRAFGSPSRSIDPAPGFGDRIVAEVLAVLADPEGARAQVREHLGEMRERARRGFDVLPGDTSGSER